MIDIDGVLADLSAYSAVLADEQTPPAQRWREFFAHIPEARVLSSGRDLTWALDGLGYTVVYSTTRPSYAHAPTRSWLADRDFPVGRALLCRPASEFTEHTRQPWQIKLAHARAVTNRHPAWLRSFVDDDPAALAKLVSAGVPAVSAATLTGLTTTALRVALNRQHDTDQAFTPC